MNEIENPITTSISVSLKVNLGNYESADALLSLSGVPTGATLEQIEESLETSKLAYGLLKRRVLEQATELRELARSAS